MGDDLVFDVLDVHQFPKLAPNSRRAVCGVIHHAVDQCIPGLGDHGVSLRGNKVLVPDITGFAVLNGTFHSIRDGGNLCEILIGIKHNLVISSDIGFSVGHPLIQKVQYRADNIIVLFVVHQVVVGSCPPSRIHSFADLQNFIRQLLILCGIGGRPSDSRPGIDMQYLIIDIAQTGKTLVVIVRNLILHAGKVSPHIFEIPDPSSKFPDAAKSVYFIDPGLLIGPAWPSSDEFGILFSAAAWIITFVIIVGNAVGKDEILFDFALRKGLYAFQKAPSALFKAPLMTAESFRDTDPRPVAAAPSDQSPKPVVTVISLQFRGVPVGIPPVRCIKGNAGTVRHVQNVSAIRFHLIIPCYFAVGVEKPGKAVIDVPF